MMKTIGEGRASGSLRAVRVHYSSPSACVLRVVRVDDESWTMYSIDIHRWWWGCPVVGRVTVSFTNTHTLSHMMARFSSCCSFTVLVGEVFTVT